MDWSWERIPAEYLVTNVLLCRGGKLGRRRGFLHVKRGRVEGLGVGTPALEGIPVLDADADEDQREAVLQIMSGETSEPGATFFNVFAATYSKVHEPVIAPIEFSVDMENWIGRFSVPGYVDAFASPITNPVTVTATVSASSFRWRVRG